MTIRDAILARTPDKPYITRESWKEEMGPMAHKVAKIMPTNSVDCCFMTTLSASEKRAVRGWEPMLNDLVAEDWVPTD